MELRNVTPTLRTEDLQKTVSFYTEVLGFVVDTLWPPESPTFSILDHGPVHLAFYTEDGDSGGTPRMTGQLRVDVDGVMEIFDRCRHRAEIEWGPEVYHYGAREFCVRDPNGYSIVFSEPTTDPPTCPGPR